MDLSPVGLFNNNRHETHKTPPYSLFDCSTPSVCCFSASAWSVPGVHGMIVFSGGSIGLSSSGSTILPIQQKINGF